MATLALVIGVAAVAAIGGMAFGWYQGYHAGLEDGTTGVSQVWPWSAEQQKGE